MIDPVNKFLFIHIPRTAGSRFCREYYNQKLRDQVSFAHFDLFHIGAHSRRRHFKYIDYANKFPYSFKDFYKLVVIRNPWDLLVSFYYLGVRRVEENQRLLKKDIYKRGFAYFISSIYQHKKVVQRLSPCAAIRGCENNIRIVRYENYDSEMKLVFNELDMESSYKRFSPSELHKEYSAAYKDRPLDYREEYNVSTKDIVWNLYREDIKKFNYEF
jgi:hypothetical protein